MIAPHKVYPVIKHGKSYFMVRYKDEVANRWLSKYAPVDRTTPEQVESWFTLEFNPSSQPLKKSINNLFPVWKKHKESLLAADTSEKGKGKRDQYALMIGQFPIHVLSHPIANLDIEKELEPKVCSDFIRSIKRAPNTVRNVIFQLAQFIDACRMQQWIDFKTVNLFKERFILSSINNGNGVQKLAGKENNIALTKEQMQTLLSNNKIAKRRLVRYWLAFSSGLRDAEISALQPRDLDLTADIPTVKVERQLRRDRKLQGDDRFKPPKKSSYRTIPLHPKVAAMLKEWLDCGWKELVGVSPEPTDPVFPTMQGLFFQPNSACDFKLDLEKSNLPTRFDGVGGKSYPFDFHSTRRTFASILNFDLDVPEPRISALMGHAPKGVTAANYIAKNRVQCSEAISLIPLP